MTPKSEKAMFANVFVCNHEIPNYCYRYITHYTHIVTIIIAISILIYLTSTEKWQTYRPYYFYINLCILILMVLTDTGRLGAGPSS